jgi:polyphosphate kinase
MWKNKLEEAGVKVLIGVPKMKVHAKLCLIKKRTGKTSKYYGFVSTGNLNEKTSTVYSDHCLITANKEIMSDVNKIFNYLESRDFKTAKLDHCKHLLVSPFNMRTKLLSLIDHEIKLAKDKKKASITLKLNSLSDHVLIEKLYEAAFAGVEIWLIVRGICCMLTENKKFKFHVKAISIVDEYLEHARVMVFYNDGKPKVFISSADWMIRNIEHRVEAACPIFDSAIKNEIIDILAIQLHDNVKARILNNEQNNLYINPRNAAKIRSQVEIYKYLHKRTY